MKMSKKNSLTSKINSCKRIRKKNLEIITISGNIEVLGTLKSEGYYHDIYVAYIKRHGDKKKNNPKNTVAYYSSLERFREEYCRKCEKCFK